MTRFVVAASLFVCLGAAGLAQDGNGDKKKEDKLAKLKAGPAVLKAVETMTKLKGYHCTENASAAGQQNVSYEGVVLKDFCALKGMTDVYARVDKYLVKDSSGRYVAPDEIAGQDGMAAAICRNPYLFLVDLRKFGAVAIWGGDEAVNGVECRIAESSADEKTKVEQINEFASKVKELKDRGVGNISGYIDKENSTSLYKVWIGKEDLRIHKITWDLEPKIKEGSIPGGFQPPTDRMSATYELLFSKHDEDLKVDVPNEVKSKLGVK